MQPPSDARAVRAQRGDDVRVVRCLWVVYSQAALWNVIPFHMADFQWEFIFVRHYVRMWFTSCMIFRCLFTRS